jgi:sulfofructose kinase
MKSILVVGLVTVDLIYYLNKLPNKGIKYVSKKQIFSTGGNACNASIAITRLGGSATFVSSIGNDFFGHFIIKELKKENINTDHLLIKNNINTSNSSITIDNNGERQIVNFRSDNLDFDQNNFIEKNIFNAYLTDGRLKNASIFILKEAKKNKKPGVLDAETPVCERSVKEASHVAFSMQGLESFTNTKSIKKALKIVKNFASNFSCVTNGEKGVFFLDNDDLVQLKPPKINAKDTLAAGDVWHGAFTYAVSIGTPIVNACKYANLAASKKCENLGGIKATPYKFKNDYVK